MFACFCIVFAVRNILCCSGDSKGAVGSPGWHGAGRLPTLAVVRLAVIDATRESRELTTIFGQFDALLHAMVAHELHDLGRKFLINENGRIFKEWTDADPANLPLVSGLAAGDVRIHGKTAGQPSVNGDRPSLLEYPQNDPLEAVMQVLRLVKKNRSILSNRNIHRIQVDREMGITLVAFKQMKTIVLGYQNYALKFKMLKDILSKKHRRSFPEFDRIDLNNVNRIVVNPVSKIPTGDHKEV